MVDGVTCQLTVEKLRHKQPVLRQVINHKSYINCPATEFVPIGRKAGY